MLIRVMYKDGRQDMVRKSELKELIDKHQIKMFKRFSGWVSVVSDMTREKRICIEESPGRERRKEEPTKNIFLDELSDV